MAHFRVSVVESRQKEIRWLFDHLEDVETPCAIMKHRISGQDNMRFTVWREGVEVIGSEDEGLTVFQPEDVKGFSVSRRGVTVTYVDAQIVKECHDFGRISGLVVGQFENEQ